jgi:hypothetical protein
MANFKSIPISAKKVKSEMKGLGIIVLRAQQNKEGVLITIKNTIENQKKAIDYFQSNNMSLLPLLKFHVLHYCLC